MHRLREKIIRTLAEEGALSVYSIKKIVGASYSTCFMTIKALEAEGLVRLKEVSTSLKGGVVKVYMPTLKGLTEAVRAGWRGEGAERLADLDPAVFGAWRKIVEFVPEAEARMALTRAVEACMGLHGEEAAEAFRETFYATPFTRSGFSREAWVRAIKSDAHLKRLAISILKEAGERASAYLHSIMEAVRVLEAD